MNVTISLIGGGSSPNVAVAWSRPADASYVVVAWATDSTFSSLAGQTGYLTDSSYTITGLSLETQYYFKVTPYTAAEVPALTAAAAATSEPEVAAQFTDLSGNTDYSFYVKKEFYHAATGQQTAYSTTVRARTDVQPVYNLYISAIDSSAATLQFSAGRNSGGDPTYYIYDSAGGVTTAAAAPATISGLIGNKTYTFAVAAEISGAASGNVAVAGTTLIQPASDISAAAVDSSAIWISFTAGTNMDISGYIGYAVSGDTTAAATTTAAETICVPALTGNTEYVLSIETVSASGDSVTATASALAKTYVQWATDISLAWIDSSAADVSYTAGNNNGTITYTVMAATALDTIAAADLTPQITAAYCSFVDSSAAAIEWSGFYYSVDICGNEIAANATKYYLLEGLAAETTYDIFLTPKDYSGVEYTATTVSITTAAAI